MKGFILIFLSFFCFSSLAWGQAETNDTKDNQIALKSVTISGKKRIRWGAVYSQDGTPSGTLYDGDIWKDTGDGKAYVYKESLSAWIEIGGGGGAGATNLTATASPTGVTVNSDTGTDATLPFADGTNAGLLSPAEDSKLANITVTQAVDLDAVEAAALSPADASATNELTTFTASSSAPGSPKVGDLWHKSSTDSVFIRTSAGAWVFLSIRAGGSGGTTIDTTQLLYNETGVDTLIPYPTDFPWKPVDIFRNGTTYHLGSFDLAAEAGIAVSKTYYVAANGLAGNDGLSAGSPTTIEAAQAKTDVDRIIFAPGIYPYSKGFRNTQTSRHISYEASGDGVWITKSIADKLTSSWTLTTSNTYANSYTVSPDTLGAVWDTTDLNAYGSIKSMTLASSLANCQATAGSYYVSGTNIYIHLIDNRNVATAFANGEIELIGKNGSISNLNGVWQAGKSFYFRNINFRHAGLYFQMTDSLGGMKVYLDTMKVVGGGIIIDGADEAYAFHLTMQKNTADFFNIDPNVGIEPRVFGYKVNLNDNTDASGCTNCQSWTTHNGCTDICVDCDFANNNGQNLANVGGGYTFLLGCTATNATPASSAGFLFGTGAGGTNRAYMERCTSLLQSAGRFDIDVASNAIVATKYFTPDNGNNVSGTLTTYAPAEVTGPRVSEMRTTFGLLPNDLIYIVKEVITPAGDTMYLPTAVKVEDFSLGGIGTAGYDEGATITTQRFRKGVSINGVIDGAALGAKGLSATKQVQSLYAASGQIADRVRWYNSSGTADFVQTAEGYIRAGSTATTSTANVSFIYNSGNPIFEYGGKTTGQQVINRYYSGSNYWNNGFQGNNFNGDWIMRYNSDSGGRLFRFTTDGRFATGDIAATAEIHIPAANGTANYGPLKFTTTGSTLVTTPEAGLVEVDNTGQLYYSPSAGSGNRYELPFTLDGSATLDFPGTAANTSSDLTITLTGAAIGDMVTLGIPTAAIMTDGTYFAWVSATNTVSVRFANNSGVTTYDPGSGTFKVRVIK